MPNPIVAIVGRPNVGKSTLFNRIMGRREAIVSDVPGTTRDRLIARVSWDETALTLVDTGGLEPRPQDPLRDQVKAQVELAVEDADAIIAMTDVTEGLTSIDQEIADWLRRTSKPLLLAVNKVDNPQRELMTAEFYGMGLGEPYPISAYHDLGVYDLMESLMSLLPPAKTEEPQEDGIMRLAIVGRTNVGKSALLNVILGQERAIVSDIPGTTRDAVDTLLEYGGQPLVLVDTAGIRRPGAIKPGIERYSVLRAVRAVERCDIALLVMDAAELATAQDAHIAGLVWDSFKGMVVVVNKWDLAPDEPDALEIANLTVRRCLHFTSYVPICFTSALLGTGIEDLMSATRSIYEERTQRIAPRRLLYALRDAFARHPPPSFKGKPMVITGIRQVDTNPPTFLLAVNNPTLVHFSYRRFLENHLRQAFGFTHTHLRLVFKREATR